MNDGKTEDVRAGGGAPDKRTDVSRSDKDAPSEPDREWLGTDFEVDTAMFNGKLNFSGDPEPIVVNGQPMVFVPKGAMDKSDPSMDLPFTLVEFGEFACQRCGASTKMPVTDEGIQEPYECGSCERQGPFQHVRISLSKAQEFLDALDLIQWPVTYAGVKPGSDSDAEFDMKATVESFDNLWTDVKDYITTYWKGENEMYDDVLTAWAMTTWFRPNLDFGSHLLTMGRTTAGKTRLLKTVARASYRGVVMTKATEAALRRAVDRHQVTPFMSEYQDLSREVQKQVDAFIKGGQKRDEVALVSEESRAGGYDASAFELFSNVGIGTKFNPADDIINRCIEVKAKKELAVPERFLGIKDEDIRNRLFIARMHYAGSPEWDEAYRQSNEWCLDNDILGRTREKALSLLTVAHLFGAEDRVKPIIEWMDEQDDDAAANSTEANIIRAIRNLANKQLAEKGVTTALGEDEWADLKIPYSEIVRHYNRITGEDRTNSWFGHQMSNLDIETETKYDGTYVHDPNLQSRLSDLCDAYSLNLTDADVIEQPTKEIVVDDDESLPYGECSDCGKGEELRFKHVVTDNLLCFECNQEYYETDDGE